MSQTASRERNQAIAPADGLLALLAGLIAGIVYALGAAPGVLFGDGGELQFAAWTAGLPHPTGYPVYMLAGWAWSHLLAGLGLASPARAMNLLSACFGALAVALTYLLARTLVALALPRAGVIVARLAALLAALTFAFTPTFWSQAVAAEVYTLHAALVALVLWLALWWKAQIDPMRRVSLPGDKPSSSRFGHTRRREAAKPQEVFFASFAASPEISVRWWPGGVLAALALAVGLGLAHHRATLLLLPVLLVFLWAEAGSRYWRSRWRWLAVMALLAAVPLLLYLYVPLRIDHTPYLAVELRPGQPIDLIDRSPAGLIAYLLGRGFAGELQSTSSALAAAPGLLPRFVAELTPVGVLLAVLGVIVLAARRCWSLLWLTAGSLVALVAFNLFYTIGDIAVFYIPPYLLACTWIAVAAGWLGSLVSRPLPASSSSRRQDKASLLGSQPLSARNRSFPVSSFAVLLFVVLFLLPFALFATHAASLNRSRDTRAGDWWASLLAADPPQGAILISNDRDEMMPLWYLQQVEAVRPDLAGVFPLLLPDDAAAALRSGTSWANVGQAVDSALATGRPVALIKPMPGLEVKARLGPADPAGLTPVLGPAIAEPPAHAADLNVGGALRLAGYTVEPSAARPGEAVQIDLHWQPFGALPGDYTSFVQLLAPDGSKVAQSDHLVGGVYYPTSLWQPGETLLDRHILQIPADAPPSPYQIYVGMYRLAGSEIESLGAGVLSTPLESSPER